MENFSEDTAIDGADEMGQEFFPDIAESLEINQSACSWTVRALTALKERLGVNIKLHDPDKIVHDGQIFLFNHFARFETVISHYLIHTETGAYCRSVASAEFFAEDNRFSRYIRGLGAVPNNHPKLLPFLAAEILRGRKVVIFPEGGMVKDRLVVDKRGEYNVYSRIADERRKHHSGAAVLALTLDAFKAGMLQLHRTGDRATLQRWADEIGLESVESLLEGARKPTLIIPSNITFYPIRVTKHLLHQAVNFFGGGLPKQFSEELLIEGNILFKDTDMDICLGESMLPVGSWPFLYRRALGRFAREKRTMEDWFNRSSAHDTSMTKLGRRYVTKRLSKLVPTLRDEYMYKLYERVTVNFGHLAAHLIMTLVERGHTEIGRDAFYKTLFIAIKKLQKQPTVRIHRSLRKPSAYRGLLEGDTDDLREFLSTARQQELLQEENEHFYFLPKLSELHDLDRIRIENPIAVAANEVAPVTLATRAVHEAIVALDHFDGPGWSQMHFDDKKMQFAWDKEKFSDERYAEINDQETATESGEPYLLLPESRKDLGIVLVHGFLASPAELKDFGEKLAEHGYPVVGVRLKGHGTSPWDLRDRQWQSWLESVRDGYKIMSGISDRVCLIGFSTGATLSLMLSAEKPDKLAGVVSVSAALKFMNRNMIFVPLVHGANAITKWLPSFEGVMPFRENESEHPHINYRNMPMRGLFELRRAVDDLEDKLADIDCPVSLYQGTQDPVVDPKSAEHIFANLSTDKKWLHMIPSKRHGILNENTDNVQENIIKHLVSEMGGESGT